MFGLCSEGGLTNCVASGDSFYLGGKTVRVAGIEAPQLYGAACPKEAALGRKSAAQLQGLLNSGELEMTKVGQDLDRYGLLLRNVAIDGKDVGRTMVASGLARDIGEPHAQAGAESPRLPSKAVSFLQSRRAGRRPVGEAEAQGI